ncbi:MAG: glycosyltransferase family 39 protein, partial [Phycisphaerales bacterium]|nr:glycosyltransferase family 39 protein [Phycisphaerales bacterium]
MRSGAVILLLASAVLIAFRLHAFDLPLETDECNYAYIAARLLGGDRLYVDVWDHQPPGVFMLFGGAIALFGDAPLVFRLLSAAFSLASLLFVYAILRRITGRSAALLGAMLFAIVSSDPGAGGEGCNREIFMNALLLAGWYFALRPTRGRDPQAAPLEKGGLSAKHPPLTKGGIGGSVIAGFAIAFATLLKTNVAVHWVFLAAWLAFDAARSVERTKRVRRMVATLIAFSLGPILIWTGTFAYFAATDRLHEFLDAAFLFNLGYTDVREPFLMRFWRFFAPPRHPFIFESALPLWLLSIPAAAWLLFRFATHRDKNSSAVFLLLAASYVATCLPGRFWPHYYYLMIPAVVLTVSTALGSLAACAPPRGEPPANRQSTIANRQLARPRLVLALAALQPLIVGSVLYAEYRHYLSQPPLGITLKRYNTRDFWGRAQGENVARVTHPDDTVFVFGNDAEIYYYSDRR